MKKKSFIHGKDLFFCLFIIGSVFLFRKIPINLLFRTEDLKPFAKDFKSIILGIVIVFFCCGIAKKYNILTLGGFNNYQKKSYWLFLIPLFFPGALLYSGLNYNCYSSIIFSIFFFLAIFVRALVEEVVFRGVIQGYLMKQYPNKSNHHICLISAAFFALIHLTNLQYNVLLDVVNQVIYAFYMGLLFSALLILTKNIWLLGISHGFLNILSTSCIDNSVNISNNSINVSTLEYLQQIFGVVLIFSPTLFIYWILLKRIKQTINQKSTS